MRESSILHEVGNYWVTRNKQGLYVVMKSGLTHSESVDNIAYTDISSAIARANYLDKRNTK